MDSANRSEEAADIVLVEDNPDDVDFFIHTFEKAGIAARLHVLPDGAEALDFVFCTGRYATRTPSHRPKVIILDLKLPKVSGLEVLRRLKAAPQTRGIPVVVLSSSQEERDLAESYELGANSYIVKPMEFEELCKATRMIGQYWLQLNHSPES
jgi:two-component system response regulator